MHDAHLSVHILNRFYELTKVVSSKSLRKGACLILDFDETEEVSLLNQLQHDEVDLDLLARLFDHNFSIDGVVLNYSNNVWVFQVLQERDFIPKYSFESD